jgi:hypothetical protein
VLDIIKGGGVRSAVPQDHGVPWMDVTRLWWALENTNVVGARGKKAPVKVSAFSTLDVDIDLTVRTKTDTGDSEDIPVMLAHWVGR